MDDNNVNFLVLILNHSYVRCYHFTKQGEGNMISLYYFFFFLQISVNLYFKIKCKKKKKKMGLFTDEKVNTTYRKGLTEHFGT